MLMSVSGYSINLSAMSVHTGKRLAMALFLSPARRCLVEDAPVYYPFGGKLSRDALQNYYGPQKEIDVRLFWL